MIRKDLIDMIHVIDYKPLQIDEESSYSKFKVLSERNILLDMCEVRTKKL